MSLRVDPPRRFVAAVIAILATSHMGLSQLGTQDQACGTDHSADVSDDSADLETFTGATSEAATDQCDQNVTIDCKYCPELPRRCAQTLEFDDEYEDEAEYSIDQDPNTGVYSATITSVPTGANYYSTCADCD